MPALIAVAVGALLFFRGANGSHFWTGWAVIELLAIGGLALKMIDRVPFVFVALATWILLNASLTFTWLPMTSSLSVVDRQEIQGLASDAAIQFILLAGLFFTQWKRIRFPLAVALYVAGIIHSLVLIVDQVIFDVDGNKFPIGLIGGNRSIGASFVVIWLFFVLHIAHRRPKIWAPALAVGIPAVLVSHSGISYFALLMGGLTLLNMPFIYTLVFSFAAFALAPLVKSNIYSHLTRYEGWPIFFDYWKRTANPFFGWGLGTFPHFGPLIQIESGFMAHPLKVWGICTNQGDLEPYKTLHMSAWPYAHNDWLQILLELGIPGLILSILVYLRLLHGAVGIRSRALFVAIIAAGVVMIANYPLHLAPTAILLFWIAFEAMEKELWIF